MHFLSFPPHFSAWFKDFFQKIVRRGEHQPHLVCGRQLRGLLIVLYHVYSQLSMVLRWSLLTASLGILMDNSLCDFPKLLRKSSLAPFIPEHKVEKLADKYAVPALAKSLINSALWMCNAGPPFVALHWLTLGLIHLWTLKKYKITNKQSVINELNHWRAFLL